MAMFIILPPVASAPINLMAVQEGLTSIRVSWSPPTPLGDTTGYRIYYSGGSSISVDVSDGSTDNCLLTGLQNGESYNISIVSVSQHFTSNAAIVLDITLGKNDVHCVQWKLCVYISLSPRPVYCQCDLHNIHLHLPLLECSQRLSGDLL